MAQAVTTNTTYNTSPLSPLANAKWGFLVYFLYSCTITSHHLPFLHECDYRNYTVAYHDYNHYTRVMPVTVWIDTFKFIIIKQTNKNY